MYINGEYIKEVIEDVYDNEYKLVKINTDRITDENINGTIDMKIILGIERLLVNKNNKITKKDKIQIGKIICDNYNFPYEDDNVLADTAKYRLFKYGTIDVLFSNLSEKEIKDRIVRSNIDSYFGGMFEEFDQAFTLVIVLSIILESAKKGISTISIMSLLATLEPICIKDGASDVEYPIGLGVPIFEMFGLSYVIDLKKGVIGFNPEIVNCIKMPPLPSSGVQITLNPFATSKHYYEYIAIEAKNQIDDEEDKIKFEAEQLKRN